MAFTARIHIKAKSITPTKKNILVTDMEFGQRTTQAGIILPGDDKEERGIRPRWCRVLAVGPANQDVKAGEYILVAHGRWTRGLDMTDPDTNESVTVRLVDPNDVLLSSDEMPADDYVAPTYHLRD
jgi:co-chaperonin GroES (HSP10)